MKLEGFDGYLRNIFVVDAGYRKHTSNAPWADSSRIVSVYILWFRLSAHSPALRRNFVVAHLSHAYIRHRATFGVVQNNVCPKKKSRTAPSKNL